MERACVDIALFISGNALLIALDGEIDPESAKGFIADLLGAENGGEDLTAQEDCFKDDDYIVWQKGLANSRIDYITQYNITATA